MTSNPFTIINRPALPCDSCKGECCSPVPFSRHDWHRAIEYLREKPTEELIRLASQNRSPIKCIFLDVEGGYTCSIYPVRPALCELYGYHPNGACSYAPELANTMTQEEANRQMRASVMDVIVGISGPMNLSLDGGVLYDQLSRTRLDWADILKTIEPTSKIIKTMTDERGKRWTIEARVL